MALKLSVKLWLRVWALSIGAGRAAASRARRGTSPGKTPAAAYQLSAVVALHPYRAGKRSRVPGVGAAPAVKFVTRGAADPKLKVLICKRVWE